jgi:hypothetical protein
MNGRPDFKVVSVKIVCSIEVRLTPLFRMPLRLNDQHRRLGMKFNNEIKNCYNPVSYKLLAPARC